MNPFIWIREHAFWGFVILIAIAELIALLMGRGALLTLNLLLALAWYVRSKVMK